jgi:hypothetical protein
MTLRRMILSGLVAATPLPPYGARAEEPAKGAKDAPTLLYSVPLAAKPAAVVKLTLCGLKLEKIKTVTCNDPKVRVKLAGPGKKIDKPKNAVAAKVGDGQCDIELTFTNNHAPAAVELRAVTDTGTSTPYKFRLIPDLVSEAAGHSDFGTAQKLPNSAVVCGAIQRPKESDLYRVDAVAGEEWQIVVEAQALGSPADLLLTVFGPSRQILGIVDDSGPNGDPTLRFTAKETGSHTLLLMEANDLGAPLFGYLLRVGKVPKK